MSIQKKKPSKRKPTAAANKLAAGRDPAYRAVNQQIIYYFPVCLQAALDDRQIAGECVGRFEKLTDDPDKIGREMAELFVKRWGLDAKQSEAVRDWPGLQLMLIKQTVILAGRRRIKGQALKARVLGRVGVPRQTTVSWTEPDFLDITLIGPEAP